MPLVSHEPSPEARQYKQRFDKAKQLLSDPESKLQAKQLMLKLK
jgi:hypothetical protein